MNYIYQIRGFWNWRKLNELSSKQADLYYAILECCNISGWKSKFNIPNSTLESMCRMSKSDLHKNRNILIQLELIDYDKGKKGSAGLYAIRPFYENNFKADSAAKKPFSPSWDTNIATNMATNSATNSAINSATNPGNIPKLKKTKLKNNPPLDFPQGEAALACQENLAHHKEKASPYPPLDQQLAAYTADTALLEALEAFILMRKKAKKPLTEYGFHCLLRQLDQLSPEEAEKLAIVQMAVSHGWLGFYALDKAKPASKNSTYPLANSASQPKQQVKPKKSEYSGVYNKLFELSEVVEK
ncbi:MAG: hypothetical protein RR396_05710 [Clostridiales bacterium]